MERYSMFADISVHDSILSRCQFLLICSIESMQPQSDTSKLLCGYGQTDFKIDTEKQKTQKSQHSIVEEQSWKTDAPPHQDLLQPGLRG